MSVEVVKALVENIKALSKRAAEAGDSGDAMRLSQAASNVANSACAVLSLQLSGRVASENNGE